MTTKKYIITKSFKQLNLFVLNDLHQVCTFPRHLSVVIDRNFLCDWLHVYKNY